MIAVKVAIFVAAYLLIVCFIGWIADRVEASATGGRLSNLLGISDDESD